MIGIIGSIAFALHAIPEVYRAYKTGRCELTWGLLALCIVGYGCSLFEAIVGQQWWLLFNYIPNSMFMGYLIYKKVRNYGST